MASPSPALARPWRRRHDQQPGVVAPQLPSTGSPNSSREGTSDKIPGPFRKRLQRNAQELEALVTSDNMYPGLDRAAVRKIAVPVLLLSREKRPPAHTLLYQELETLPTDIGRPRVR